MSRLLKFCILVALSITVAAISTYIHPKEDQ